MLSERDYKNVMPETTRFATIPSGYLADEQPEEEDEESSDNYSDLIQDPEVEIVYDGEIPPPRSQSGSRLSSQEEYYIEGEAPYTLVDDDDYYYEREYEPTYVRPAPKTTTRRRHHHHHRRRADDSREQQYQ